LQKLSLVAVGFVAAIVLLVAYSYTNASEAGIEQTCTTSGGNVTNSMCCKMTGDFPNTCMIGACGCSPEFSHLVKSCECPEGKCFDGEKCA